MNTSLRIAIGVLVASMTSGCSVWTLKYGRDKPQFSYVMPDRDGSAQGSIYLWNPNTTTAYISKEGQYCILSADVFKSRNIGVDAGLKASALQGVEGLDATMKTELVEQITRLSEKDAAGTFLSVALFNICMISHNQKLSGDQVTGLVEKALASAAGVANPDKKEAASTPAQAGTTP